jgi:hypothetical protein
MSAQRTTLNYLEGSVLIAPVRSMPGLKEASPSSFIDAEIDPECTVLVIIASWRNKLIKTSISLKGLFI